MTKIKILKVSNKAAQIYSDTVKGNKESTKDQIRRKLTRNVLLSNVKAHESKFQQLIGTKVYTYGNLHITVRWGKVIDIVNYSGGHHYKSWKKDKKKYKKLTVELGII